VRRAALALLATLLASPALAQAIAPDPTLTPGAVRTTDAFDVCSHGTSQLRHMSRERSDAIMAAYGLPSGPHEAFEIDHLIPLSIGGSDADQNLWPEPRRMIETEWPAERKDELEMRLHNLVCTGQLEITVAQRAIADDWTEAWARYVGPGPREHGRYDGVGHNG
jgi:hypothetical protein